MSGTTHLPHQDDKQRFVREMFDRIAPRYALVNTVMTLGMDRRWRRLAVESLGVPTGSTVVDLACGPGEMCRSLAAAGLKPVGADLSWGMLAARLPDLAAVQADAARIPVATASVDAVTCGFGLRNFADLRPVLTEIARILRPGGRLALLEVSVPENRLVEMVHRLYFRHVVPLLGAVLSDRAAYRYLPESVVYLPAPGELCGSLVQRGFADVVHRHLAAGATQLVTATRPGP